MAEWVDYKDRQGGTICSETVIGAFNLRVHPYLALDIWYLSCDGMFDDVLLGPVNLSEAKRQAVAKLQSVLQKALDEILKDYK